MKKYFIMLIILLAVTLLAGCSSQPQASGDDMQEEEINYQNIAPAEAKNRLANEEGIILLDVRTEQEYVENHIPNSLLIPVEVLEKGATTKLPDKYAIIFIYCRSGRRSVTAANILIALGYKNIYNLGGINDWPYETKKGEL